MQISAVQLPRVSARGVTAVVDVLRNPCEGRGEHRELSHCARRPRRRDRRALRLSGVTEGRRRAPHESRRTADVGRPQEDGRVDQCLERCRRRTGSKLPPVVWRRAACAGRLAEIGKDARYGTAEVPTGSAAWVKMPDQSTGTRLSDEPWSGLVDFLGGNTARKRDAEFYTVRNGPKTLGESIFEELPAAHRPSGQRR